MADRRRRGGEGVTGVGAAGAEESVATLHLKDCRSIVIPFERYEVGVVLGPGDRFLGISYVGVRTSFIQEQETKGPRGFHDIDSLFPPEEGSE